MLSWSPALPVINADNFSQAAGSGSAVVILLWAIWDPTSRSLDARLQQIREGCTNLRFYAMDLNQEQNWPLAREWGVVTTPTLVCFLDGVLYEKQMGLGPESQTTVKLSEWNSLGNK